MEPRDDLVSEPLTTALERTCRATVGDSLRSITYFTPEQYQRVYLRADLTADADIERLAAHERAGFETGDVYDGSELGGYEHTVHSFENGYVTRVTSDERGVFLTTDGLTMRGSQAVADALVGVLEEEELTA